jgi:hypothetical protein
LARSVGRRGPGRQAKGGVPRLERPHQPVRATAPVRRVLLGAPGLGQPGPVDLPRAVGVDHDVAGRSPGSAVGPARPGASSACPRSGRGAPRRSCSGGRRRRSTRSGRVGVGRSRTGRRPRSASWPSGCRRRSSATVAMLSRWAVLVALQPPAAHVVAAGDHPGPDPLGDPGLDHEVADLGLDPHEVARARPRRAAWEGWIQSGLAWASSSSHFALALRVWICTGSRKVEMSGTCPSSSASGWMWLRM